MTDYIKLVSDKLLNNIDVVFYTVGSCTFGSIRELHHRFGLLPSAVCDGDTNKQGRTFKGLYGISVISPDEAISRFNDALWYIPSLDYRYQIIGYLTEERGIPFERILNYTPVTRVRSCAFLQKALIIDGTGHMRFCWRYQCPQYKISDNLDADRLLALRDSRILQLKSYNTRSINTCTTCPQVREEYYPITPMSWSVNFFCSSICNYKCMYCTVPKIPAEEFGGSDYTLGEFIDAFKHSGLLSDEYGVILSTAGEPLIHPKRKDFYKAFDGFEMVINTNGSVFDEDLFELMGKKKILLLISVDAGRKETYAQLKGVDFFAKVKANLTRYSQSPIGMVALKYLFVPDINDNVTDVDGFIEFCIETGAIFVVVSVDYFSLDKISENTRSMVNRLKNGLFERNILCVPYTAWETAEYTHIVKELVC
jgi:sulfatase maturation enzyme AslB (radical SAM superfamily)